MQTGSNHRPGWSELVRGGVAEEQVSFQVSLESSNCSNNEWQTSKCEEQLIWRCGWWTL